MKPITLVKSRLSWCCALVLLTFPGIAWGMGPGSFWFDFKGSPTPYSIKMHAGEQHSFQFCATADVVKAAHQHTWPGTPLGVTLAWSQPVKGSSAEAIPWGPIRGLPQHTKMVGPIADGRYCSEMLKVNYGSFPKEGVWLLRANIDGTRIGTLMVNWTLMPRLTVMPNKAGMMAKPKAVIHPGGLSGQSQSQGQHQQRMAPTQMHRLSQPAH